MTSRRSPPWRPPFVLGNSSRARAITIAPGEGTTHETPWVALCMLRGLHEFHEGKKRRQYNYQIAQGAAQLDFSSPLPDGVTAISIQVAMTATIGTVTGWFRLEESGNVSPNGPGLSLPGNPLAAAILENRGRAQAYGISARVRLTKSQGAMEPFHGLLSGSILLSDPIIGE